MESFTGALEISKASSENPSALGEITSLKIMKRQDLHSTVEKRPSVSLPGKGRAYST